MYANSDRRIPSTVSLRNSRQSVDEKVWFWRTPSLANKKTRRRSPRRSTPSLSVTSRTRTVPPLVFQMSGCKLRQAHSSTENLLNLCPGRSAGVWSKRSHDGIVRKARNWDAFTGVWGTGRSNTLCQMGIQDIKRGVRRLPRKHIVYISWHQSRKQTILFACVIAGVWVVPSDWPQI